MINDILISRTNLINNVKQVMIKNPNTLICAMVKANAYGVGMKEVVKTIDSLVDFYGVACFFEAENLKKLTDKKILILGSLDFSEINSQFSYSCNSLTDVKKLIDMNRKINIHIKINTGMNRYGFSSIKDFKKALILIRKSKLNFEGLYTHFATTDEYVKEQVNRFMPYIFLSKKYKFQPLIHTDNSFVNNLFNHHLDMVRIGFNLYNKFDQEYKPVVKIKSKIVQINQIKKGDLVGYDYRFVANGDMRIGIVPFGYADGFDLGYIGMNLMVRDKQCRVLNVCMDCLMLDISDVEIKKGDDIFLLNENNSLKVYSDYINSSEYEVMTKFSYARAKRKFID